MSVPAEPSATQARHRTGDRPFRAGIWVRLSFFVMFGLSAKAMAQESLPLKDQPHVRWPVAAAEMDSNKLVIANRCGSISIVDTQFKVVIDEIPVGDRLADIEAHPNGELWLAVDEDRNEMIELVRDGNALRVAKRHAVSSNPVALAVSPVGLVAVASIWSRKVTIFVPTDDNSRAATLEKKAQLSLGFNPGEISFQREHVLRRIGEPARALTREEKEYGEKYSHFVVGDAFSDVASRIYPRQPFNVEKGLQRVGWWFRGKGLTAPSLPRYADGIESFLHLGSSYPVGPSSRLMPNQRGELLFGGDAFGSLNCNDCHRRGHSTYELSDTLADGTTGTPKRIPTLLGTRLSDPWAWNGKFRNLDEQVRSSLETTMHVTNYTPEQIGDLTAFLHTLKPPPPLEPATDDPTDQAQLARGQQLFTNLGCAKCHVPPLTYTSADTYDVGLTDEAGHTKFNPPSLRGVSQGYSFFHDGRAKTIAEVFTVHGHQLDRPLSDQDLADLLRFLRSL